MKVRDIGLVTALLFSVSQSASALMIKFDYTYDDNKFFGEKGSIQRDVLQHAGEYWGTRINDNLTAAISTQPGVQSYDVNIRHPSTGAKIGTGNDATPDERLNNFSVQKNEYIIYVGARNLGASTLGTASFGGSGNIWGDLNNFTTRGQTGAELDNPNPTDFSSWGGWASFDNKNSTNWYFDEDTSTFDAREQGALFLEGKTDFFSVALHEIGHVLGIGTARTWDIQQEVQGEDIIFTGLNVNEVATGDVFLVDGERDHFVDGTMGFGGGLFQDQEALMDPSAVDPTAFLTRKLPTNLDLAALQDVGWEVTAVPVPPSLILFLSGCAGLISIARKK
jgi:hypothetical protein